jgi:hypothetical protein
MELIVELVLSFLVWLVIEVPVAVGRWIHDLVVGDKPH